MMVSIPDEEWEAFKESSLPPREAFKESSQLPPPAVSFVGAADKLAVGRQP
jgi:hypothetical protein